MSNEPEDVGPDIVRAQARAKIATIERQAGNEQPGWSECFAQLTDEGRESVLSALLDKRTFNEWRALNMVLAESSKW